MSAYRTALKAAREQAYAAVQARAAAEAEREAPLRRAAERKMAAVAARAAAAASSPVAATAPAAPLMGALAPIAPLAPLSAAQLQAIRNAPRSYVSYTGSHHHPSARCLDLVSTDEDSSPTHTNTHACPTYE